MAHGDDDNCLLDLPADFTFPVEYTDLPVRHVYSTPKPPAKGFMRNGPHNGPSPP